MFHDGSFTISMAGKVCNCFLLARDNGPHRLCASCRGKTYNISDRCEDCYGWTDEMWHHESEYLGKLSFQRKQKKERGAKATSSSSSFSGSSPLCQLSSPYDTSVVTSVASSVACAVTFEASSLVVSSVLFISLSGGGLTEPSCNHLGRIPLRLRRRWRPGGV